MTDDLVPVCFTKSGYTEETQYFLLSTPSIILRQIRVKPEHCPFVSDKIGNQTCYPNLLEPGNYHYEDIESTYKGYPYYPDLGGSYVSGLDTTHYTYYGKGGYTVFLNGTIDNVTAQIDELRNVSFIDEGTRAVILEFGLYSPNANRYMLFEILVEFTHIPSIHQQRHMIVLQPLLNDDNEVIINYLLILFAVGYSIQELAEIIVACGSILEEEREKRIKKLEEQLDTGGSTSSLYGGSSIFWKTIKTGTLQHLGEVWNVIDILVNANVTIYVSLSLYQTYLMPSSPFNVSMSTFWEIYNKQAIAAIFGSLGLVATWFRLLYFLLLIPVVGPLVIGMLRMYRDVLYFLFLLIVFICGFTAAFDIVFAGKIMEYSGYKTSFYTTLRMSLGDVTYTDSKTLFPNLPLTLFGLSLIVIYVLICVILLVNLLIAMMGGTFDDLRESIQQKWHHLSQELLLHYERFVLLPPPFNFVHFIIFPLFTSVPIFCVSDQNWRLTGKWNPDQDWKNRQKLRLEKSAYQNKILSPYSTDRKKQYELEKIMTVIDSELNKAKKKIAADMRYELCRNNWNDSRNAGEFGKLFTSVDETLDRVTSSEDTIDETVDEIQDHLLGEEILAFAQDKEKEIEKELKEKQQKGQGTGPSSARGEVQPTENAPETGTLEMTGLDDYQLFFNDTDKNLIKEALTRPTNTQTPSPSYSEESE
uniref:Uncharacterized protein n=1 Tax=Arcella intermedia TaxID=1963864 RepID=A0A6B2KZ16_9EUKA